MALHRLLGMTIGVPAPSLIDSFYREIGLEGGEGSWGGTALRGQIRICETPYRQLSELRIGCEDEADLSAIASTDSE